MYKFIFADDESIVRNNISRIVDLKSIGFSLADCCANGYEVLEAIEKELPDLVILDINMPFISGLEVAEQIRKSYPQIKIIFLTGHTEFQYAKRAIDLGAFKYIVKPISPNEITCVLEEVKRLLDEEKRQISKIARLAILEHSYTINKKILISDLINNLNINENVYSRVKAQGFSWTKETKFQVALLSVDKIKDYSEWTDNDDELMVAALYNVTEELATKNKIGMASIQKQYVILIGYGESGEALKIVMQECVTRILHITNKSLKLKTTAGLGEVYTGCEKIYKSYLEGERAMTLGVGGEWDKLYTKEDLDKNGTSKTLVWHAINYIKEHYIDPNLSVEDLGFHLNISVSYLRALFKRQTGYTIIGYITRIRMEQAHTLVKNTKLKGAEIAKLVGYMDVHYFSYCFKRYYGVNITEIRNQ